jgi:hypothetical protein
MLSDHGRECWAIASDVLSQDTTSPGMVSRTPVALTRRILPIGP